MCDACIDWDGRTWHKKPGNKVTIKPEYCFHRAIWESANGAIPAGYQIHHRNGDIHDNRLENLEILTHSEHSRLNCREKLNPFTEKAVVAARESAARNRAHRIAKRPLHCVVCGGE